jgi:uncharacterized membrane protein
MPILGIKGRSWLKSIHILFSCGWVGGAVCLVLLINIKGTPSSGDELYAVNASLKLIDDFVIIPSALGCLITGSLISWLTNWGFFKHNWIIVKWAVTLSLVIFGTFWLGPWINTMARISASERLLALNEPEYLSCYKLNRIFGLFQHFVLISLVIISVLKPWKKRTQLSESS